jgi:hypothetical protein
MRLLNLHAMIISLGSVLLISPGKGISEAGYKAITRYANGFVAVGSEGRIDMISPSGAIIGSDIFPGENLNCIVSNEKMIIAAGDSGTVLVSYDGDSFRKVESSTDNNINSITIFNKTIIAGADQGEIVLGDTLARFWKTRPGTKGNIVSVSAGRSVCYGVTDEGEIIHSGDGINWEIFDLNQVYRGFYQPGHFTKVLVTDDRIAVTGFRNDGSPLLMFSSQGRVWTERNLNYLDDNEMEGTLRNVPNDILYDEAEDQFFIACNKGNLMKLSSCPHCNKLTVLTGEDLTGISSVENTLMIVGNNFFIKALIIR